MDFMDLLLAEALAAGMARQAAEARQRPPPDNFFILPPDSQAWRKLYMACNEENMVICVEITDDSHPGSCRAQPKFVELARDMSQIPFFRVKIGFGRTYDELRQDLGGVRFTPTIIVVFFDDRNVRTTKIEGEADIDLALKTGAIHRVVKEYVEKRVELKVTERIAQDFMRGASARQRLKREAEIEYERKLKEEMERKELVRQKEERRRLEDEKQKRIDDERREEEELARRRRALEEKRNRVEEDLLLMDLSSAKPRDIMRKMDEGGISHVGATSKEDLLAVLKSRFPKVKQKLENAESGWGQSRNSLSGYNTSTRHSTNMEHEIDGGIPSSSPREMTRLKRQKEQLEECIEDMEKIRVKLEDENEDLKRRLRNQEREIDQKNKELMELRSTRRVSGSGLFGSSSSKDKEFENELIETRLLYSCVLDDIDILGFIAKGDGQGQGVVARVKCKKNGLPDPSRVYAMKIISGILDTSTLSQLRVNFKDEYEILSGLPPHKNIIKLFAFFYDRPKTQPKLSHCGEGMALCMLMEQLSQNMSEHLAMLKRGNGPPSSKVIGWLKDIIDGSHFLFSHNICHRDMKLDNLLISGNTIKISDFGLAIRLDSTMKLPFVFSMSRGGNEAHLAPEILNVRPAPGKFLDYTKQPVWEVGVLAYELAGHRSPFERSSIDQRAYNMGSLPRLLSTYCQDSSKQQAFPANFANLVQSLLEFDPHDRPTLDQVQKQIARL